MEKLLHPISILRGRFSSGGFFYSEDEGGAEMTKLHIVGGDVYTPLKPAEVRQYLQGGSKGGSIQGFEDASGKIPIIIAVHAIEYIYE